jgi:signal transduction histidine kinase
MIPHDVDLMRADVPAPSDPRRGGPLLGGGGGPAVSAVRRPSPSTVALVVVAAAAVATAGVVLIPEVRFGYRAPGGHIVVETAAVVIASLVASLALGRLQRGGALGDLLLTAAFTLLALVNLLFTTIPAVFSDLPNSAATWGAVGGRLVGSGLLAAAAVAPGRRLSPRRGAWWLASCVCVGLVVAAGLAAAATWLPEPVDPELSPTVGMPGLDGPVLFLAAQFAAASFYGVAVVGFLRRTAVVADPLYAGLAVGSVLAACSATTYALFPSLFSDWIYLGDLFRLVSYLVFLVAAFREIGSYWRGQSRLAVLEERQRLARDLHDGVAQELAFILRHAMRLPPGDETGERIRASARRALTESRHAIHALATTCDRSLEEGIADAAARSAGRTHVMVELDLDSAATTGPRQREALARIAAEAVANAGQHAGAEAVRVSLSAGPPLRLQISDDGRGFDPTSPAARGAFGLAAMTQRARDVGASLHIRSAPGGGGTTVEVTL